MPNWCNNNLTLHHEDPSMIQRAIASFHEGKLCQEFHPMQPQLLEDESWYNWRVDRGRKLVQLARRKLGHEVGCRWRRS